MKKSIILLPKHARVLVELGENIRLARLRRKLSTTQVAERAGISRKTLYSIESGSPAVSIGNYTQVLVVLGLVADLGKVARDDILGRKLQDAGLSVKKRAPRRPNSNT
ncbi:MAG: transcriptional regulator [Bacteroidetes bacterium]|nr:MAG: transcriptional regulator [Bacteroidota bacterium]